MNPGKPPILIVEDNEVVARALAKILGEEGYETEVFQTGRGALDYMERQLPMKGAIVDIHLPDVSGLVVSSKLREGYGMERPIIVVSGDTSIENIKSLADVGATYFISKPFKPELLLERVKALAPVGG